MRAVRRRAADTTEDGDLDAFAMAEASGRRRGRRNRPDPDTHLQAHWTGGPALVTRGATGVLWGALLTGPAALLLALSASGSASAPPPATAPVVDRAGEQAAVSEFAGRFVSVWLQAVRGQEDQLARYVRGAQLTLPAVAWTAGPTDTADVRRFPDGTWMVQVGVTVTGEPGTARRYFSVPVQLTDTGLVALTLPAPVAGPAAADTAPRLAYRYRAAPSDPVVLSAQQFLTALLTGAGDVNRLIAPGTAITSVSPAPYTAVKVTDVATAGELTGGEVPADGTQLRVLVTATATGQPNQQAGVQYPLSMAVRGGRWEVTALDPAPAVQRDSTTPAAATAAPSGSPSTAPTLRPTSPVTSSAPPAPTSSTPPTNPLN